MLNIQNIPNTKSWTSYQDCIIGSDRVSESHLKVIWTSFVRHIQTPE